MLKKVIVIDSGDSDFCAGQTVSNRKINEINANLLMEGKTPAKIGPMLLGISKSSVETDSFLSAASFQETTKVLTDAAINAKVDELFGIKENVIIGKLIPAGTGSKFNRETTQLVEDRAAELIKAREERVTLFENENKPALPSEVTNVKEADEDSTVNEESSEVSEETSNQVEEEQSSSEE